MLVIGGGVVGMTSALQLLEKGYKVTVLAKEFASPVASGKCITSEIAGALWEWPPAVCGRHIDEKSLERSKVWCMDSYAKFMELAMKPKETGAYLRQSVFYFKEKVLFIFYIRLLEFSLHVRDGKYGTGIASEFYNVLILYC